MWNRMCRLPPLSYCFIFAMSAKVMPMLALKTSSERKFGWTRWSWNQCFDMHHCYSCNVVGGCTLRICKTSSLYNAPFNILFVLDSIQVTVRLKAFRYILDNIPPLVCLPPYRGVKSAGSQVNVKITQIQKISASHWTACVFNACICISFIMLLGQTCTKWLFSCFVVLSVLQIIDALVFFLALALCKS